MTPELFLSLNIYSENLLLPDNFQDAGSKFLRCTWQDFPYLLIYIHLLYQENRGSFHHHSKQALRNPFPDTFQPDISEIGLHHFSYLNKVFQAIQFLQLRQQFPILSIKFYNSPQGSVLSGSVSLQRLRWSVDFLPFYS